MHILMNLSIYLYVWFPILQISVMRMTRQKPVSGKFWKDERSSFRSIKKGPRKTFQQRVKIKEEKLKTAEFAKFLIDSKASKKKDLREKMEENQKRKQENALKNEVIQLIKNPAKIKRMKKKQLRSIAKRDVLNKS